MAKYYRNFVELMKITKNCQLFLLIFFVTAVLFTRLFNLEGTARFTQDESSDLARMHEYYVNKQLSLVGPISSDRSKVFSSLGYYMVMPFSIALNFTPVSPVYGMAFLGVLTAFLMILIAKSVNKKKLLIAGVLIVIWYPLVLVSRWAWNPHFVIFWAALGILFYQYRNKFGYIAYAILGLSFGMMFHHHYVSIISTLPFLLLISLPLIKKKDYKSVVIMFVFYLIPFIAFVLFDIKNPPGLFFGRYLTSGKTPHLESEFTVNLLLNNFFRNISVYFDTFVQNLYLKLIFAISLLSLLFLELKNKFYNTLIWTLPSLAIIFAGIFLDDFQIRYVLSGIIFIFVWLLQKRELELNKILANISILILIIGSILTIKNQLTYSEIQPNMRTFTNASDIIIKTIRENQLNNANVAALSSDDTAPLAERYRDYIRMKNTGLRAESEYDVSEHLFVITTANDEILRNDKSFAMVAFKDKGLRGIFEIENSDWKVIWYGTN